MTEERIKLEDIDIELSAYPLPKKKGVIWYEYDVIFHQHKTKEDAEQLKAQILQDAKDAIYYRKISESIAKDRDVAFEDTKIVEKLKIWVSNLSFFTGEDMSRQLVIDQLQQILEEKYEHHLSSD